MPELETKRYPRKGGNGSLLLLLFLVIICVAVISAQTGFPVLFIDGPLPKPQATIEPLPQVSASPANTMQTIARQSWYAIQVGSYETESEAKTAADQLRARGGAGYIYKSGSYRLMVSCYPTQEEAESVRQSLISNGEFDSPALYHFVSDEIRLSIVATPVQASALSQSYTLLPEMINELSRLSLALDRNTMDAASVRAAAATNYTRIRSLIELMNTALGDVKSPIVTPFLDLLGACANAMDQLQQSTGDTLSLSSQLKYDHLDILCQFINYVQKMGEFGT